jgi:4-hydroxy-tetrahydrodipicolinate reductase
MGEHVRRAVDAAPSLRLAAALEAPGHAQIGKEIAPGVALVDRPGAALEGVDVAIDFTVPAATLALVGEAAARGVALVIGTTGLDERGQQRIREASERVPIVQEANFALGVHVMIDLVAEAARRLADYDLEVLELHHARKLDAPSGTALRLAEAAAAARGVRLADVAVYHREGETGARPPGSIGLQSLRAGDSVGEHTVLLAGPGERLEIAHRALSRENFATGAVRAAAWVRGKPPGLYRMRDVLR